MCFLHKSTGGRDLKLCLWYAVVLLDRLSAPVFRCSHSLYMGGLHLRQGPLVSVHCDRQTGIDENAALFFGGGGRMCFRYVHEYNTVPSLFWDRPWASAHWC